jgi:RNA 2',3'-cyclic 3'-phosphodiesterase
MPTHWSEGGHRTHSRDDFPPRDSDTVRAFVAIRMNAQVEEAIAATIAELTANGPGVRWVPPANLHVTLKFLGAAVDPRKLEPLAEALHRVALGTPEFDVIARGVGVFPNFARPHVVWAGLAGAEPGSLAGFASRVDGAAAQCGFERESKRWTGHLTIGRVRDSHNLGALRDAARAMERREFGRSRIESMTLYRSHLSADGSRYQPLATFLLQRDA